MNLIQYLCRAVCSGKAALKYMCFFTSLVQMPFNPVRIGTEMDTLMHRMIYDRRLLRCRTYYEQNDLHHVAGE